MGLCDDEGRRDSGVMRIKRPQSRGGVKGVNDGYVDQGQGGLFVTDGDLPIVTRSTNVLSRARGSLSYIRQKSRLYNRCIRAEVLPSHYTRLPSISQSLITSG